MQQGIFMVMQESAGAYACDGGNGRQRVIANRIGGCIGWPIMSRGPLHRQARLPIKSREGMPTKTTRCWFHLRFS
jgi:hypothetical protein